MTFLVTSLGCIPESRWQFLMISIALGFVSYPDSSSPLGCERDAFIELCPLLRSSWYVTSGYLQSVTGPYGPRPNGDNFLSPWIA